MPLTRGVENHEKHEIPKKKTNVLLDSHLKTDCKKSGISIKKNFEWRTQGKQNVLDLMIFVHTYGEQAKVQYYTSTTSSMCGCSSKFTAKPSPSVVQSALSQPPRAPDHPARPPRPPLSLAIRGSLGVVVINPHRGPERAFFLLIPEPSVFPSENWSLLPSEKLKFFL